MFKALKRIECTGLLDLLINQGVISCDLKIHKIIYECFLCEKEKGFNTTQAVTNASILTKTSERNVYRIIKKMRD